MDVSLRVGHFDARLAAEAINPESDLGSHLQGVCSTDIKPEKDVKCQRVVTEGLEGDGCRRFLQDVRLRLDRAGESAHDQLCGGAISHSNDEIVAMMRVGQSPIDDILFQQVAVGHEDVDTVKFAHARATGA
jgi:hypothetical protein